MFASGHSDSKTTPSASSKLYARTILAVAIWTENVKARTQEPIPYDERVTGPNAPKTRLIIGPLALEFAAVLTPQESVQDAQDILYKSGILQFNGLIGYNNISGKRGGWFFKADLIDQAKPTKIYFVQVGNVDVFKQTDDQVFEKYVLGKLQKATSSREIISIISEANDSTEQLMALIDAKKAATLKVMPSPAIPKDPQKLMAHLNQKASDAIKAYEAISTEADKVYEDEKIAADNYTQACATIPIEKDEKSRVAIQNTKDTALRIYNSFYKSADEIEAEKATAASIMANATNEANIEFLNQLHAFAMQLTDHQPVTLEQERFCQQLEQQLEEARQKKDMFVKPQREMTFEERLQLPVLAPVIQDVKVSSVPFALHKRPPSLLDLVDRFSKMYDKTPLQSKLELLKDILTQMKKEAKYYDYKNWLNWLQEKIPVNTANLADFDKENFRVSLEFISQQLPNDEIFKQLSSHWKVYLTVVEPVSKELSLLVPK